MNYLDYEITKIDQLKTDPPIIPEQLLLKILRDKGAPIEGFVFLRIQDGWAVDACEEPHTGTIRVRFFKEWQK